MLPPPGVNDIIIDRQWNMNDSEFQAGIRAVRKQDIEIGNGNDLSIASRIQTLLDDRISNSPLEFNDVTEAYTNLTVLINDLDIFEALIGSIDMGPHNDSKLTFIQNAINNSDPIFFETNRRIIRALTGYSMGRGSSNPIANGVVFDIKRTLAKSATYDVDEYLGRVLDFFQEFENPIPVKVDNAALKILQKVQQNGLPVSNATVVVAANSTFHNGHSGRLCAAIALTNMLYTEFHNAIGKGNSGDKAIES
jgi:hypothetical protein